jgi:hypothetical protein
LIRFQHLGCESKILTCMLIRRVDRGGSKNRARQDCFGALIPIKSLIDFRPDDIGIHRYSRFRHADDPSRNSI